jgi:hypothetical protein
MKPSRYARPLLAFAPLVLATAIVARASIKAIYAKVGHPAAALDDAYIHFQYARAIAEGHPFRYQAGEPVSTGATSFLWPAMLAIPHLLGFRGESILWPAWTISFVALGALAWETYALARALAGRAAAAGAGATSLLFGGLVWGAASGMEVVPFAWIVAHTTRRAAEWSEQPSRRTRRELVMLIVLAALAPLLRPEGAITSIVAGVAVGSAPRRADVRARLEALAFACAALLPNLFLLALTGHATSSTAQVKLLFGNPYHPMPEAAIANARILVSTILDGEVWSAEFLPKGGAPVAFAGLAALLACGHATKRRFRAIAAVVIALSMFVPCTYVTFLWNRLRYLWPFAPGWFVGLACLARALAFLASRVHPRSGAIASGLVAGAFAGAIAMRLEWVIDDVAQSASGINRQQSALGHWANEALPRGARIGVNDTGAIAYFGNRRTFDIVGLTTPTEGRYWVGGAASRVEHYERLRATSPASLPTHFIVYPEWMGTDALFGKPLRDAVVTDSTILGGQVMRAYEARWDALGTGEAPWTKMARVDDAVDVADLESEAEHGYELLGAREGEQDVELGNAPDGAIVLDGGRTLRRTDRFVAKLRAGQHVRGIARVQVDRATAIVVRARGVEVVTAPIEGPLWTEILFDVPPELVSERTPIEVNAPSGTFTSFHYFFGE